MNFIVNLFYRLALLIFAVTFYRWSLDLFCDGSFFALFTMFMALLFTIILLI